MNLVIDIGNTVAKLALFQEDKLVEVLYDNNRSLEKFHDIQQQYSIEKGIVASVIALSDAVIEQLRQVNFPILYFTSKTRTPIHDLYRTPETLGSDRLAAVVGAHSLRPTDDILVIDAGTAITFEFIDAQGNYYGGNISPGVQMRFKALHTFTDKLPLIQADGEVNDFGLTTETAIRSGVLNGILEEINGYIFRLKEKYPKLLVFLTGGDLIFFDTKIKSPIFADKFLVLKGLNTILEYNDI